MTTISAHAPRPAAGSIGGMFRGLAEQWRDGTLSPAQARGFKLALLAALALFAALWGSAVAFAGPNALVLCVSLIGCVFILLDFRIGVVLLVLLLPISRSHIFPHQMFGLTGLNPLNLLMVGTLGSYVLQAMAGGAVRRFLPPPLLWLYVVPIVIAGFLGARHVGEIAPQFNMIYPLEFQDAAGYLRETVFKPLMLVVFAILVGIAAARSQTQEKFLAPMLVSIWIMSVMAIVFVVLSGAGLAQLASSTEREFLSPLGLHANDLGRLYAVAYALLLFTWAQTKDRGLSTMLLASMAVVVVALILTFSRSAFVGFIVVNGLFILWNVSARTMIFVCILVGLALVIPGAVYERVFYGVGQGLNAITAGRVEGLWLPLLPEVLKSPIWGSGHNSILWSDAMRSAGGANVLLVTHPHNAYLQALLDMGVAGLVLLCAYFAHVWKGFRALGADASLSPTMRGFYQGAAAALAATLIVGLADGALTPRSEQVFLWFAIGMMYAQWMKRPAP